MIDLSAYHFLVVRPEKQARQWAQQLQALGAQVTLQPMMSIIPIDDAQSTRSIINQVLAFAEYQKAIFISQNAVVYGLEWLDKYWPQLPIGMEYFAIGKATASLLENSTQAGVLQYMPEQAMNSEDLLAHPRLQGVTGQKIIIFRGKEGRTYLAEQLNARGASVDYCEVYQRRTPKKVMPLIDAFRQTTRKPVLAVHSAETLDNVCEYVDDAGIQWLTARHIVVPGQRVAKAASDAGFQHIVVAENATHESMITALINL
ncbi:MAG: uroporphyrinogen-III synthase [Candidatus Endobugula sp.]